MLRRVRPALLPTGLLSVAALVLAACGGGAAAATATPAGAATVKGPTATRAAAATATQAPSGGNAARGKELISSQACNACHTISSVPGAVGVIGPKLDGVATRAATRKPGLSAAQYLEESLREPTAYTVEGFAPGLMPKLPLTDAQIGDLVAFLLTLK